MPLYEYECDSCHRHFERIETASAATASVCPSCGAAARRLLSAPALRFKGSGWYVTDYGKGNGCPAAAGPDAGSKTPEPPPAKTAPSATEGGPASGSGAKVA